uniref:Conjugal transfer protein traG n=1 Tax=Staphylococcus aureus TaxID=1280 RepID=E4PYE0_STAAU|nr:Conjugal transfer protein traG [Staphylococcus aureus]
MRVLVEVLTVRVSLLLEKNAKGGALEGKGKDMVKIAKKK